MTDYVVAEVMAQVMAWFERYDAMVAAGDLDGMADQAVFPVNEISDDEAGNGVARAVDRATFLEQMRAAGVGADVVMTSTRTPTVISPSLVFVLTDAEFTVGEETSQMRYGDLLMKVDGSWRFQTMVAGGWGAQM